MDTSSVLTDRRKYNVAWLRTYRTYYQDMCKSLNSTLAIYATGTKSLADEGYNVGGRCSFDNSKTKLIIHDRIRDMTALGVFCCANSTLTCF